MRNQKILFFFLFSFFFIKNSKSQILGLDISKYDTVDFNAVVNSGVQFVIIRVGSGRDMPDEKYESHYNNAKGVGLNVGAYYFGYELSAGDAAEAAKNVVAYLNGKQFEYPIYYDIEWEEIFNLGREAVSNIAAAFCDVLEKAGYYCGIYSSLSFFNEYFTDEVKQRYDLWIAAWDTSKPDGAQLWQFTNRGQSMVSGITDDEDVDLNYDYVNYPPIIKENHFNGY